MVDIAALAAYKLYYANNEMIKKKTHQRRLFLKQLSEELAMPMVQSRFDNNQIMRNFSTKMAIQCFIGREAAAAEVLGVQPARDQSGRIPVAGSCHVCISQIDKKRRKTRKSCSECKKPVCDQHSQNRALCVAC